MTVDGRFISTSFKISGEFPDILKPYVDSSCNEIFNNTSLLFFEEKYMDECKWFQKILDKFQRKKFNSDLYIYEDSKLVKMEDFSFEVKLYNQIISTNNINGIKKKDLNISVKHFEKYKKTKKISFIQSIYILLFLADTTEFENNTFIFKTSAEDKEISLKVFFDEFQSFNLFQIYSWIIDSKENLQTRLKIIREIIIRKQSFFLDDEDLCSATSAFNRIIKEETDKYFSQVNVLKDDFLELSKRSQESYHSLHLKFLGWCSSIVLFIYSEVRDRPSKDLIEKLFLSNNEKSVLFLFIFIVSLVVIWIIFVKEIADNRAEYDKIKEFYIKQLFFDKDDFSNLIDLPSISKSYKIIFAIVLISLILRGVLMF